MADIILSLQHLSISFPGVKALDDVSFDVRQGTVHALVGENGAGKSSLIKILAGVYKEDEGKIIFNGAPISFKTPFESINAGISVVHQELKLANPLSVTENIFLGKCITKNGIVDWKGMHRAAGDMIKSLGVDIDVKKPIGDFSVARKQIVEICKAINHQCSLMIMDEPSATLTDKEMSVLYSIISKLKQQGITVIYISHRLDEIFHIADYVTVLRDGKHIGTSPIGEVDRRKLISMMVGRALENEYPKVKTKPGETVLRVENLCRKGVLNDISFEARQGELLGFAGLVGAGRTELARAILGIDPIDSGRILVNGKPVRFRKFKHAVRDSLGLVPEDRKTQGLVLPFPLKQNISLVNIQKIMKGGILSNKLENKYAEDYVDLLSISTPSINTKSENLSGGNQQKVVVAKWLMQNSRIIFLDEPTRGVDVGAKTEIYKLINEMLADGKTVIMISSELPEILGMCDKILVMHEGSIVGRLTQEEATQELILSMCV